MGSYQNLVNAASGSIVAGDNTSPRERYPQFYDEEPEPNQLPDLQKWSDIVGLQWQRDAQGATIKYIFRSNIANTNTKSMIRTAFIKAGQTEVGTYPGFDFTIGSDETGPQATRFFGLLGTYHGAGPAYLLAQHRTDFGHKRITKIRIWNPAPAFPVSGTDYRELAPSMMLFVEDVPSTT